MVRETKSRQIREVWLLLGCFVGMLAAASDGRGAVEPPGGEGAEPEVRIVSSPPAEPKWTGEPISLSLKDADLVEVVRSLARLSKLNVVIDPSIEGKVTVELHRVPWDQALHVILKSHRLAMEVDGRVASIAPAATRRP